MTGFLVSKTLQYGLVLFLAVTLNFALPRLMPGDPLQLLAGDDVARLDAAQRQQLMARYGLDKSVAEQYVLYLAGLLRGDLGYSFGERRPVVQLIGERLPWTLLLVGSAILLSSSVGIALGSLAAWRRGRWTDIGSLTAFTVLDALPSFWIGMLLIVVFAVQLRMFPLFGALSLNAPTSGPAYLLSILRHLVLPVTTLTLASVGGMFLITRYAMIGVLGEDYILTARAKGAREWQVALHALRNAALPVLTVLLLRLGQVTGGAVVVETVFSYPGLGRLMYQAVLGRDYPVVQGAFFLFTVTVITANLLADLAYLFLDPRVRRYGAAG